MSAAIPLKRSAFLSFNIGHVITIVVCVTGFVYGYGDLNRRVTNLETGASDIKAEWRMVAAQMAVMNVKLSTIENDLAWVKKNIK